VCDVCGRYAASRRPEDLVEEFEVDAVAGEGPGADPTAEGVWSPDYNVAPTKLALVVLERRPRTEAVRGDGDPEGGADDEADDDAAAQGDDGEAAAAPQAPMAPRAPAAPVRWLRLLKWGLVPSWAKAPSAGNRMINARADTLLDKPAFKRAALSRRCLVPADGWYEWQKSPTETDAKGKRRRQPFYLHPVEGEHIAFAGLYEFWRDPALHGDDPKAWLTTFAVITVDAVPGVDVVHDRMPLALTRDRWDAWLDPGLDDADGVRALLVPPPPGLILAEPVSTRVNAVSNNGPELVAPVPLESLRGVVDPATGELIGAGETPLF